MTIPLALRQASADDLAFFFSSTLRSHFYSSATNRNILAETYYDEHKRVLERLLRRPTSMLGIACDKDEPKVIYGFVLAEPLSDILHYIYVKRGFRGFGIGRRLLQFMELNLAACEVSHWTGDLELISRRKGYTGLVFNPYLLGE